MTARPAKVKALRALMTDTGWAIFFLDGEGEHMTPERYKKVATATDFIEVRDRYKASADLEQEKRDDMTAEVWSEIVKYLDTNRICDPSYCEVGAYIVPRDGLDDVMIHSILFVPNIAEYQAATLARACDIRYWVSPKALYDGKIRMPAAVKNIQWCGGATGEEKSDWENDGPMKHYQRVTAAFPECEREMGIFTIAFFSRCIAAKMQGENFADRLSKAMKLLAFGKSKGWAVSDTLAKHFDVLAPSEMMINFVLPTNEEMTKCTLESPR